MFCKIIISHYFIKDINIFYLVEKKRYFIEQQIMIQHKNNKWNKFFFYLSIQ